MGCFDKRDGPLWRAAEVVLTTVCIVLFVMLAGDIIAQAVSGMLGGGGGR